jgi:glycosyltransferase involved in cell wall biosynthesis
MIEAMSAGLACVLTSVGMIEDYVVGGRDALIVSPKNPTELADAIKILLIDCTAREKISKNGLLLARSNFTLEQGVSLLSDEINRITIKK